jgi:hypothetical protein
VFELQLQTVLFAWSQPPARSTVRPPLPFLLLSSATEIELHSLPRARGAIYISRSCTRRV